LTRQTGLSNFGFINSSYGELQHVKRRGDDHISAFKPIGGGNTMFDLMAITKALADENRVRLLAALQGQELCVCQLIELIGLAPSTVSKHLSILRSARMIQGRKNGRWMYYRLADDQAPKAARTALAWLLEALDGRKMILDDKRRLAQVMKTMPHEACQG
jgi:ArsR family transcriptional regulator